MLFVAAASALLGPACCGKVIEYFKCVSKPGAPDVPSELSSQIWNDIMRSISERAAVRHLTIFTAECAITNDRIEGPLEISVKLISHDLFADREIIGLISSLSENLIFLQCRDEVERRRGGAEWKPPSVFHSLRVRFFEPEKLRLQVRYKHNVRSCIRQDQMREGLFDFVAIIWKTAGVELLEFTVQTNIFGMTRDLGRNGKGTALDHTSEVIGLRHEVSGADFVRIVGDLILDGNKVSLVARNSSYKVTFESSEREEDTQTQLLLRNHPLERNSVVTIRRLEFDLKTAPSWGDNLESSDGLIVFVILCAVGALVDVFSVRLEARNNDEESDTRLAQNNFILVVEELIDRCSSAFASVGPGLYQKLPKNFAVFAFFSSGVFGLAIQIIRMFVSSDLCAMLQSTTSDGYSGEITCYNGPHYDEVCGRACVEEILSRRRPLSRRIKAKYLPFHQPRSEFFVWFLRHGAFCTSTTTWGVLQSSLFAGVPVEKITHSGLLDGTPKNWRIFSDLAADDDIKFFNFDPYLPAVVDFFQRSGLLVKLRFNNDRSLLGVGVEQNEKHFPWARARIIEAYRDMWDYKFTLRFPSIGNALNACATGILVSISIIIGELIAHWVEVIRRAVIHVAHRLRSVLKSSMSKLRRKFARFGDRLVGGPPEDTPMMDPLTTRELCKIVVQ